MQRQANDAAVRDQEDRWGAVAVRAGLLLLVLGALMWIEHGFRPPVTQAGLAGTMLLICALGGSQVVKHLRKTGKPRTAPWALGAVAVLLIAAAWAFGVLPSTQLFRTPAPVWIVLGTALIGWALLRESPAPPPESTGQSLEQWLRDLAGLLEGRHDLTRRRAAELADDAAAQLAATGCAPQHEFGPVERHARRLAELEAPRPPWWRRERTARWLNPLVLMVLLTINLSEAGPIELSLLLILIFIGDVWYRGVRRIDDQEWQRTAGK